MDVLPLETLGSRIMICGPSNAGKSTLAAAIADKIGVPVVHIDLFRHLPDTDWVQRSDAEFRALHDEAIEGDGWVMDGNYSSLFPQRIERATGIILVGDGRLPNLMRYLRRTLFQRDRIGTLEGNKDSLKWEMITWVLMNSPRNLQRLRATLPHAGRPYVEARSMREVDALYAAWGLKHRLALFKASRTAQTG